MKNVVKVGFLCVAALLCACKSSDTKDLNTKYSNTTGWTYNNQNTTKMEAKIGGVNGTPIGMVLIEGGKLEIGQTDEFITAPRDAAPRSISVGSFYMDKYEITNINWREYQNWTDIVFGRVAPNLVRNILPDSTVWREELAYNEPYVQEYYQHPAFALYPVVGVSWKQATDYCRWRTDRVNEKFLVDAGAIIPTPFQDVLGMVFESEIYEEDTDEAREEASVDVKEQIRAWQAEVFNLTHKHYELDSAEIREETGEIDDEGNPMYEYHMEYRPSYEYIRDQFVFNSEKYLYDKTYVPVYGKHPQQNYYENYNGEMRKIQKKDGILVVGYRLPTEAEWIFAAYAPVVKNDGGDFVTEGKIYPWSGYHPRNVSDKQKGQMQANFVRGKGDYMGVSGALNDGYLITAPVNAFAPNDFGLYNMAGNVNEWVMDVYRETTNEEATEYNSFRGNIYHTNWKMDADGGLLLDSVGCLIPEVKDTLADKRNFRDGDASSIIKTEYPLHMDSTTIASILKLYPEMDGKFKLDPTDVLAPRINDESRLYKGGSWKDRVYWLNPTSRRYLDENQSSSSIGFRCAMTVIGDELGGRGR